MGELGVRLEGGVTPRPPLLLRGVALRAAALRAVLLRLAVLLRVAVLRRAAALRLAVVPRVLVGGSTSGVTALGSAAAADLDVEAVAEGSAPPAAGLAGVAAVAGLAGGVAMADREMGREASAQSDKVTAGTNRQAPRSR